MALVWRLLVSVILNIKTSIKFVFLLGSCCLLGMISIVAMDQDPYYPHALDLYYNESYETSLLTLDNVAPSLKESLSYTILTLNLKKKLNKKIDNRSYSFPSHMHEYQLYTEFLIALYNNNLQDAQGYLQQLRLRYFGTFISKYAQINLLEYYVSEHRLEEASVLFDALQYRLSESIFQQELLKLKVEMEIVASNEMSVLNYYGQLLIQYPEADQYFQLWNKIRYSFRNKLVLSDCFRDADDHLLYLKNLVEKQFYSRALEEVSFIKTNYPQFVGLQEVKLIEASIYFHEYRYSKVVPLTKEFMSAQRSPQLRNQGLLYLAESLKRMNQGDAAVSTYKLILESEKLTPEYVERVYYELAKLHFEQGSYSDYKKIMKQFERYKRHYYYQRFQWEREWEKLLSSHSDLKLKKDIGDLVESREYADVLFNVFSDIGSRYSDVKLKGVAGVNLVPFSYDTYLLLKQYFSSSMDVDVSSSTTWLYESGYGDLELKRLQYQGETNTVIEYQRLYDLSWLQHKTHRYFSQINTVSHVLQKSIRSDLPIPSDLIKSLYKRPYWEMTQSYSKKYKVDPYLVLAVMNESSQFLPSAKDDKNRIGLMKLDPVLSKELTWNVGKTWLGGGELYNPDLNIQLGTYYLSQLLTRYNHDVYLALVAFYMNIETANKLKEGKGLSSLQSLATDIPLEDTRVFIENVLTHYLIYKVIYYGESQ